MKDKFVMIKEGIVDFLSAYIIRFKKLMNITVFNTLIHIWFNTRNIIL